MSTYLQGIHGNGFNAPFSWGGLGNLDSSVKEAMNVDKTIKRGGGIRAGESFDTGVNGDNSSRYNTIKQQIQNGQLRPSINAIRKNWNCGYDTARVYINQLIEENIIENKPDSNGFQLKGQS